MLEKLICFIGRQFRDFMNGLDNLHEYLKFSYPKIKPPSFFCNDETESGMTLHYRSKRKYFLWYAIGQIKEVGRYYYQTDVSIKVVAEKYEDDDYSCVLQLIFDNRAYMTAMQNDQNTKQLFELTDKRIANTDQISMMPLKAGAFFNIFPFCLVFDSKLIIKAVGVCLQVS
jgi:guanylate cyclase